MSSLAIQCDRLSKRFGEVAALSELSLEVQTGEVTGYLGPNGAGKTTTIRILMGLSRPTSGTFQVLGGSPQEPVVRARIGYLPGELRLDQRFKGGELLDHWARLRGGVDPGHRARLCERLQLDPGQPVRILSTGNRRKVGLVGAFQSRPDLLILDEPTSGLDPLVQAEFLLLVREAREAGATVFLSSHALAEVQRAADRVAVIRGGRLLIESTVEALRHSAVQRIEIWFDEPSPERELLEVVGVSDLVTEGSHVSFRMVGDLHPLLTILASHRVRTLIAPEPDLEEAFLALYQSSGDERASAAGRKALP
jgi:ABC-2 type transport system ATP-binding protein